MFWPDTQTGVDVEPARKTVQSAVRKYFTEGGLGVPPTVPGGDWFNQITNELLNVLIAAGIDPSKVDDDQILQAIKKVSNSTSAREALRRSYAEAGYTLVDGSFEAGGTLTSSSDVLLREDNGSAYSWNGSFPHVVTAGTIPSVNFVNRENDLLRSLLASTAGAAAVRTSRGESAEHELTKAMAVLNNDGTVKAEHVKDETGRVVAGAYATLEPTRGALDAIDNAGAVIIIGDSITNGANATAYNKCFSFRLARAIFRHIAGESASDSGYGFETILNMASAVQVPGISHNGTLVTGSGAADSRLRLNSGQSISVTGREIKVFDVFYDATVSSGSLTFSINGAVTVTKAVSGTDTQTTFPTNLYSIGSIHPDDTVTITASGGTVFVTGLITLRESQISPYVTVVGRGSWGFDEFSDATRATEVAAHVNTFRNNDPKTLFIFLGTNNIYNPSLQKTPSAYINALDSLIAAYTARLSKLTVVLSVPLRANETIFPLLDGFSYDDYVDAIVRYADENNYQLIRFDHTGINNSFYSDGVHPNNAGHSALAAKACETVGISYSAGGFHSAQSIDPYRESAITFNDSWGNFGGLAACQVKAHKLGRIVHLSGIAQPNGSTNLMIGTLPVGFRPIGTDEYLLANGNSSPVHLKITQAGVITVSAVARFISLQGVSFVIRPVQ